MSLLGWLGSAVGDWVVSKALSSLWRRSVERAKAALQESSSQAEETERSLEKTRREVRLMKNEISKLIDELETSNKIIAELEAENARLRVLKNGTPRKRKMNSRLTIPSDTEAAKSASLGDHPTKPM
jgi:septal ring factor EnvC (AmiA/AmiB activator)